MIYTASATAWHPYPPEPQPTLELRTDNWMAPSKDTYFFCDLHADADAFLRSLKLSHLVTRDSTVERIALTTKGQCGQIIIGGDCFDKGPSNLALLRLIGQLQQAECDLILLAGNHDIRIYAGLLATDFMDDLRQSHFFVRMGRKTASLFAEIHHQYGHLAENPGLAESEILKRLFPKKDWFAFFPDYAHQTMTAAKIDKEMQQIRKKQQDFLQACAELGMDLQQVYQAVTLAKQLFLNPEGEFAWFFQSLDLVHLAGSYCFCHAGLDDRFAEKLVKEGAASLNQAFRTQMREGRIFEIYYSEFGNVFRTKYRENDWPLTDSGSERLRAHHIYALVNGHRSHQQGQQLFLRQGLLNFECDTKLNANCRRKSNLQTPGEAVTIFYASGLVSALSSDFPVTKQFHPRQLQLDESIHTDRSRR